MVSLQDVRTLYTEGRRREAVAAARELASGVPCLNSFLALGAVELAIGQTKRAAQAFENATLCDSECTAAWNDWGSCLAQLGDFENASEKFRRAVNGSSAPPGALANWGACLLRMRQAARAESCFIESLRQGPTTSAALGLCRAWAALGRKVEALSLCESTLRLGADSFEALDALMELKLGTPRLRLEWAQRLRSRYPGHAGLRALHRRALRVSCPDEHKKELEAYRQHLQVMDGAVGDSAGLEQIASLVANHSSFQRAPIQHATRGGWHSGDLLQEPEVDLRGLEDVLEKIAREYWLERHQAAGDSEFVKHAPKQLQLHAWAVRLEASHHQALHFHPEAWASACLYLRIPGSVTVEKSGGHLYFEALESEAPLTVAPQLNRLVIFPSCLEHGTIPLLQEGQRLSVAFDMIG